MCGENRELAREANLVSLVVRSHGLSGFNGIPQVDLGTQAWKRLIGRAFSSHEVISSIEATFTSADVLEITRDLRGDDSQSFVNVIHKVQSTPLFARYRMITLILFDPFVKHLSSLIRLWVCLTSHHTSGSSV